MTEPTRPRCPLCSQPYPDDPYASIEVSLQDMTFREAWTAIRESATTSLTSLVLGFVTAIFLAVVFGGWRLAERATGDGTLRAVAASPITWVLLGAAICWPFPGVLSDTLKNIGAFAAAVGLWWERSSTGFAHKPMKPPEFSGTFSGCTKTPP